MSTLEILKAARAKIEKPENWNQGYYAANAHGQERDVWDVDACKYCALGAIAYVARVEDVRYGGLEEVDAVDALEASLPLDGSLGFYPSVVKFNDRASHADVLALFDRAIATEEAKAGAA